MTDKGAQRFDVMLLEDSPEDAELYKRYLSAIPGIEFDISEVSSVREAKNELADRNFDCYVVDYSLPDASGLDFIRHLKSLSKENRNVSAIVFVTGQGSEEIAAEAIKLGAHEYLTKKSVSDGFFSRPVMNAIERAQLTAQLQHFRDRLEQSNKDLSEFTHTAAHDLKSPLRRILSYCEILQDDAKERLNEEDKRVLGRMSVNAKRMQNLINSLLSYSMIGYEEEEKQMTDLTGIALDVVNELESQIKECGGEITVENMPSLAVYPVRIRQVLVNLVSNALKYKGGAAPRIIINAHDDGETVTVQVKDNGPGIDKSQQQEIFKDFKRLHANEDIEGTGLGLSICKKIVTRHGGRIWVESEPGQGATFFFTLRKS